jgi:hypothetical protein
MASLLGLPGSDDRWAEVEATRLGPVRLVLGELGWARGFLGPWLAGQVRGRHAPPGARAVCKRPDLRAVETRDA